MKIHITSDIHIDFWVDIKNTENKQIKQITELVETCLPETSSDTILIAGDIGHYNRQNELLFKVLRKYYKHVLWVFGNHDLYMISNNISKKFKHNSWNRLNDMIERSNNIEGVYYLDGNIIEINGVKYSGYGMWYDGSYALNHFAMSYEKQLDYWLTYMNDANLIKDPNTFNNLIDWKLLSSEAKTLAKQSISECDVFMSHVGPDSSRVNTKYHEVGTGFYYFDGTELLENMSSKQLWVYGHTHDKAFFNNSISGSTMICNPLGYPLTNNGLAEAKKRKFLEYEVGSEINYDDIFKDIR